MLVEKALQFCIADIFRMIIMTSMFILYDVARNRYIKHVYAFHLQKCSLNVVICVVISVNTCVAAVNLPVYWSCIWRALQQSFKHSSPQVAVRWNASFFSDMSMILSGLWQMCPWQWLVETATVEIANHNLSCPLANETKQKGKYI